MQVSDDHIAASYRLWGLANFHAILIVLSTIPMTLCHLERYVICLQYVVRQLAK